MNEDTKEIVNKRLNEEAKGFSLLDIFAINTAMHTGKITEGTKEAWVRIRAKLILATDMQPPRLIIPDGVLDNDQQEEG